MSIKRTATTDLNHDNWDQEDPSEKEEMGAFKPASKEVLEKRVIKTAKRRAPISSAENNKSAFSGFGGFNKTQPSSFDFLANLTNGSKNVLGTKSDTSISSSLFTSKPTTNTNGGLFGTTSTSSPKPAFGISGASPFASTASVPKTEIPSMTFTNSKADSTVGDSPFKTQPVSSSVSSNAAVKLSTSVSSTLFGASSLSPNQKASLIKDTPPKQSVSNSTIQNATALAPPADDKTSDPEKEKEIARNKYYSKLKGLNESVSSWIVKHVESTPLCFLTPIFKDYENYLKDIQEEYEAAKKKIEDKPKEEPEKPASAFKDFSSTTSVTNNSSSALQETKSTTPLFGLNNKSATTAGSGIFGGAFNTNIESSSKTSTPAKGFSFGTTPATSSTSVPAKPEGSSPSSQGFSFGVATTAVTSPVNTSLFSSANSGTPSKGFSFGISTTAATSPTNTATNGTGLAPFSFGIAGSKPFSFSPQAQQNTEAATKPEADDEDQPPKVEYTPVVEENSVFDKKCKIFVKKDGNFADKGVGTLYIKKIEDSGKHQLLVRANTNLGTVLLNLILGSSVPTQRMGKNNVMLVCIPTPDSKPPPTPVLIRVKTGEEADELLETLNKYKS